MIDAGVARKLGSDCSHTLPVIVSCIECFQNSLVKWEARIKGDFKHDVTDELNQLRESLEKVRSDYVTLQRTNDGLVTSATKATKLSVALSEKLHEAEGKIKSLSAQLHAEQAVRTFPKLVATAE